MNNQFMMDEEDSIPGSPQWLAANMPSDEQLPPPPQAQIPQPPPQNAVLPTSQPAMPPPELMNRPSFFDNPDFLRMKQILEQKPNAEQIARQGQEEKMLRRNAMYDNLSAIAAGGHPSSGVDLEKFIQDKREKSKYEQMNKYKALLDMYGNVQNAQNTDAQKRLATLNTYLDTTPGSAKAQANKANFLGYLNMMKSSLGLSAKQMESAPEDMGPIIANIDSYSKNADKMSYAEQERVKADLDKSVNQVLGVGRSVAIGQQGMKKLSSDEEAKKLAQANADKSFELLRVDKAHNWANQDFDNRMKLAELAHRKEKDANNSNKIKLSHDQNKLMGEIADNEFKISQSDALIDTLEGFQKDPAMKGKVSGWFTGGVVNPIKSMFNQTTNDKIADLGAKLTRLFSVERKTFAGSNVTPSEMEALAPMIPNLKRDSEETIINKLKAAKEWLASRQVKHYQQMQFDADGNPIDQSLIAQRASSTAHEMAKNDDFIKKHYPQYFQGNKSAKTGGKGPDASIQKYADEHLSGDYEKAKKILTSRGYKPNE